MQWSGLLTPPNNLLFWVVVAALATTRFTLILHRERIAKGIRRLFGISESDDLIMYPETFWGHLFECYWCLSVWTGLFCTLILFLFPYLLLPFALSMMAIVLDEKVF